MQNIYSYKDKKELERKRNFFLKGVVRHGDEANKHFDPVRSELNRACLNQVVKKLNKIANNLEKLKEEGSWLR